MSEESVIQQSIDETSAFVESLGLTQREFLVAIAIADSIRRIAHEMVTHAITSRGITRPVTVMNAAFAISLKASSTIQEKSGTMDF